MKIGSHAEQLLQAVGEPALSKPSKPLLSDFDWGSHGVSHAYLILMTGRCGSTWLTSILRETRLAGNPGEFFNAAVARRESDGAQGLQGYLGALASKETSNGRFGLEIDSTRLRHIEALVDWRSVFPAASTASFFLYRTNLLAQAWSWASARKSGLWHVRTYAKVPTPTVSEALPTSAELIQEMVRIRRDEQYLGKFFDRYGYRPYYLDYESLLTELDTEIRTILRILSVDLEKISSAQITADNKAVAKIQYTEKSSALAAFADEHTQALTFLRQNRFQISAEELSELFGS